MYSFCEAWPWSLENLAFLGNAMSWNFIRIPRASPCRAKKGCGYPILWNTSEENLNPTKQMSAQAICLEEMLCCSIPEGALFYGEPRRRTSVVFSSELRERVKTYADEMHQLFRRGYTPKATRTKSCNACSLKDLCLPQLARRKSVSQYLHEAMEEEQ